MYSQTPPPPPPKPPSFNQATSPPLPQGQFQNYPQSPAHGQAPPVPPHPSQQSPVSSAYPPRTSSWTAPYPPDEGLRRISSPDTGGGPQHSHQEYSQQRHPLSPSTIPSPHHHHHHQQQQQDSQQPQQQPSPHSPQQSQPLPLPSSLTAKSKTDLAHLLATPALQHALIHAPDTSHSSLQASQQRLRAQLATNLSLASTLQALEGSLEAARSNTSAQLLRVRGLETAWKKKQGELERRLEPWGPRELHQRLGAAIAEQEGMCAALESSFVEGGDGGSGGGGVAGEREVGEWVRRVREGRRLVALRQERKRRWDEGRVGGWR